MSPLLEEMPDRAEESLPPLKGRWMLRKEQTEDNPLSANADIPAQGTPYGRLFKGNFLEDWFV